MWGRCVTEAFPQEGGEECLPILLSSSVGSQEEMLNPLEWKEVGSICKLLEDSLLLARPC